MVKYFITCQNATVLEITCHGSNDDPDLKLSSVGWCLMFVQNLAVAQLEGSLALSVNYEPFSFSHHSMLILFHCFPVMMHRTS